MENQVIGPRTSLEEIDEKNVVMTDKKAQLRTASSPASRLLSLETHSQRVEEKLKLISEKNEELRRQRDEARLQAKEACLELEKMHTNCSTAANYGRCFIDEGHSSSVRDQANDIEKQENSTIANEAHAKDQNAERSRLFHFPDVRKRELKTVKDSSTEAMILARESITTKNNHQEILQHHIDKDINAGRKVESHIESLQRKLLRAEKLSSDYDKVALDLENQLSEIEIKYRQAEKTIKNYVSQIANLQASLEEKEKETTESQMDIEAKAWRIEDLTHQVEDLKLMVFELLHEKEEVQHRAEEATNRANVLSKDRAEEINQNLRALEAMKKEIEILRKAACRNESKDIKPSIKPEKLHSSHDDSHKETIKLKKALSESNRSLERMKEESTKRLARAERNLAAAQADCLKSVNQVRTLQDQIQSLRTQHKQEIEVQKIRFETEKSELENKMKDMVDKSEMDNRLTQLEQKLKASHLLSLENFSQNRDAEMRQMNEEMENIKQEFNESKVQISEMKDKLQHERDQRLNSETLLGELRIELNEAHDTIKEKERNLSQLEEEKAALMSTIEELQKAMKLQEEKHDDRTNKLQQELQSQALELSDARRRIKDTEELIERLAAMKMRMSQPGLELANDKENKGSKSPLKKPKSNQKTPLKAVSNNAAVL